MTRSLKKGKTGQGVSPLKILVEFLRNKFYNTDIIFRTEDSRLIFDGGTLGASL